MEARNKVCYTRTLSLVTICIRIYVRIRILVYVVELQCSLLGRAAKEFRVDQFPEVFSSKGIVKLLYIICVTCYMRVYTACNVCMHVCNRLRVPPLNHQSSHRYQMWLTVIVICVL